MKRYIRATVSGITEEEFSTIFSIVKDPDTSPRTLKRIYEQLRAGSYDEEYRKSDVLCNIARNPNTPASVLDDIIRTGYLTAAKAISHNPSLTAEQIDVLVRNSFDSTVRYNAAKLPNISLETLRLLAKVDNDDVRFGITEREYIPPEILNILADDPNADIRMEVADKPNLSLEIMEKLAFDENDTVRWDIADNKTTPSQLLDKMVDQELNWMVLYSIARNDNTSTDTLAKLAKSDSERVKDLARGRLKGYNIHKLS